MRTPKRFNVLEQAILAMRAGQQAKAEAEVLIHYADVIERIRAGAMAECVDFCREEADRHHLQMWHSRGLGHSANAAFSEAQRTVAETIQRKIQQAMKGQYETPTEDRRSAPPETTRAASAQGRTPCEDTGLFVDGEGSDV